MTFATVFGVAVTLSLGRWQLSRAAEKEALQSAIDSRGKLPAIDGAALASAQDFSPLLYRPAHVKGRWLADKTVFLDNRQMHGQPGFFVITPLQLQDSQQVLLVQRGWIQRNFLDRTALPPLATEAGVVEVDGHVAPPPSRLYEFKSEDRGAIRQNLDLAEFATETGLPLVQASLQQTGRDASALLRDWPAPNTGVEKHYGYAFQWFGLSALLAILYVWFQLVRRSPGSRERSVV